jgi:hypothetical protein
MNNSKENTVKCLIKAKYDKRSDKMINGSGMFLRMVY